MNRSESIKEISASLLKAQSEMGNAVKGSKNPFFKSNYADLNSIREAALPILNKNGITVLQPTTVVDGRNYVETTLLHESGQFLSSLTEIVTAKINDPQAHGSGVSYSRRYGLQSFLCIGASDDDGEKAMARGSERPIPNKTSDGVFNTVELTDTNAVGGSGVPTVAEGVSSGQTTRRASFRKNVVGPGVKTTTSTVGDDI